MSRFERPQNTIEDAASLRVGDHIWHVYGIWPPQMGGEHIVTREAAPFCQHPRYESPHSSQGDQIVFDEKWVDGKKPHMSFASDCNMTPGHSHNDNYCFRSEADARAAVEFLRSAWESSGKIAEEIARREEDRRFYDYA